MRRAVVLIVFLPFLFGLPAEAQSTFSVRGNVGATFFQSPEDLNTLLNSGANLGVGASVHLYQGFELLAEGNYDQFTLNGENLALLGSDLQLGPTRVQGGDYKFMSASLGLRYVFQNETNAQPYALGGVGFYRTTITKRKIFENGNLLQEREKRTMTSPGFHFAMGVDFQINDTYTFFFEPRYVIVESNDRDFGVGMQARYIPVRIGLDVRL